MQMSGFFSSAGSWLSRNGGWGKACVSNAGEAVQGVRWGLSEGGVGRSSLMPLWVVQGDHRGEAGTEEEEESCSRASKKSSASLLWGLGAWGEERNVQIIPFCPHCCDLIREFHTSTLTQTQKHDLQLSNQIETLNGSWCWWCCAQPGGTSAHNPLHISTTFHEQHDEVLMMLSPEWLCLGSNSAECLRNVR